jgi:hypothetical protein
MTEDPRITNVEAAIHRAWKAQDELQFLLRGLPEPLAPGASQEADRLPADTLMLRRYTWAAQVVHGALHNSRVAIARDLLKAGTQETFSMRWRLLPDNKKSEEAPGLPGDDWLRQQDENLGGEPQ